MQNTSAPHLIELHRQQLEMSGLWRKYQCFSNILSHVPLLRY